MMRIIISLLEACSRTITLYVNYIKQKIVPLVCLERRASPILVRNVLFFLSHVKPKLSCLSLDPSESRN